MSSPTIVVCEDDEVVLRLLQVNFSMEGWTVVLASDGLQGLELIRAHRPDCVVSDLMMPRMSGLELVTAVKADPDLAAIPFVLLSAKAQADDIQAGLDAGADAYVTKPFEPLELLERIEELLAG